MTLWDLLARWLARRWRSRRRVGWWMSEWPERSKPARFNLIERYLMRRAVLLVVGVIWFKIDPFHPIAVLVTIAGLTLVVQEHSIHKREQKSLRYSPKRRDGW